MDRTDVFPLREVSRRLELVDIASLWLIGSKLLRLKLSHAVEELVLEWREPSSKCPLWSPASLT